MPLGNAAGSGWMIPLASRLICQQSSRLTILIENRQETHSQKVSKYQNKPYS
jgi:hypothetical protein